jgi:hypothetical protein
MWLYWNVPLGGEAEDLLILNRWVIVLNTIQAAAMGFVLVRTYRNSKFAYLYTCAAMMFLSAVFELLYIIFYNWEYGCHFFYAQNDKCHGKPSKQWGENIIFIYGLCDGLSVGFYQNGLFLFAFRYFEVAEMFGRED